jgi:hypothetical protein
MTMPQHKSKASKSKRRVIDAYSPKVQDVVRPYLRAQSDQKSPPLLSKASKRRLDMLSPEENVHWIETQKAIIQKRERQLRYVGFCNLFDRPDGNGAGPSTQASPASPPRTPPPPRTRSAEADARKYNVNRSQGSAKHNPQHPSRDGTESAKALWL